MSNIVKVKWIVETFGMRAVSGAAATLTLHYQASRLAHVVALPRAELNTVYQLAR
jgi:hypothetical protein